VSGSNSPLRVRYGLEPEEGTGRWFMVNLETGRLAPLVWDSFEQAEAFMDRCNAIDEGEPDSVIAELRLDADRLRGLVK
jgi:hypothetical protein